MRDLVTEADGNSLHRPACRGDLRRLGRLGEWVLSAPAVAAPAHPAPIAAITTALVTTFTSLATSTATIAPTVTNTPTAASVAVAAATDASIST